jgi:hypothetical protein
LHQYPVTGHKKTNKLDLIGLHFLDLKHALLVERFSGHFVPDSLGRVYTSGDASGAVIFLVTFSVVFPADHVI